jgi:isopenicillin-N N-acyltransferase-like protein
MLDLRQITIAGTPAEMGRSQGEQLREPIRAFVAQRLDAARLYLRERGVADQDAFLALGRKCLTALKGWDIEGWTEHCATAEAAGLDPAALYTAGNMTDVRDILLLPARADAEGCSAVLLPPALTAGREVIAAQTWDLNPGDLEFVVAVHRRPATGHRTWSVTCAGCPSLIGMNDAGLAVGTTNIKTRGSRVGIPYLSILHRAIRCATLKEASTVIEKTHRAAAHTYWAAERQGAAQWECTAHDSVRRDLHDVPIVQTNHCQVPAHQVLEGEPASPSSRARLARLGALVAQGRHDVESLRRAFADRTDGVDSINRFAEDAQGTSTNACIVAIPGRRELHACRGSADRGAWVKLAFG